MSTPSIINPASTPMTVNRRRVDGADSVGPGCWGRLSGLPSTETVAYGSANFSRNWRARPTSSVCSTACTPTCPTMPRRLSRCTAASSSSPGPASAPGPCMVWVLLMKTCRASSPSAHPRTMVAPPIMVHRSCRLFTRAPGLAVTIPAPVTRSATCAIPAAP